MTISLLLLKNPWNHHRQNSFVELLVCSLFILHHRRFFFWPFKTFSIRYYSTNHFLTHANDISQLDFCHSSCRLLFHYTKKLSICSVSMSPHRYAYDFSLVSLFQSNCLRYENHRLYTKTFAYIGPFSREKVATRVFNEVIVPPLP